MLAINSVRWSGGILVLWPVDALILTLMVLPGIRRPWLVFVAGELATLAGFVIMNNQMVLAYTRVGLMAFAIPSTYLLGRRFLVRGHVGELRTLLPFLGIAALTSGIFAFLRSLFMHVFFHFTIVPWTITTATSTFTGYAFVTTLILLLLEPSERGATSIRQHAVPPPSSPRPQRRFTSRIIRCCS